MAFCKFFSTCSFYQNKIVADTGCGEILKKKYCESADPNCARFMVATQVGREFLDDSVFPNMQERARSIIASHGGAVDKSSVQDESLLAGEKFDVQIL